VALDSLMLPIFDFSETNNGTDPMMSITANRVKVTVNSSLKWIFMILGLVAKIGTQFTFTQRTQ